MLDASEGTLTGAEALNRSPEAGLASMARIIRLFMLREELLMARDEGVRSRTMTRREAGQQPF